MSESNVLHMTARRARGYFSALFAQLRNDGVVIDGDQSMRSGDAITKDGALSGNGHALVGFASLKSGIHNVFGFAPLQDDVFVNTLVAIRHEERHCRVFDMIRSGNCGESLLCAHVAKQGSNSYYVFNRTCFATEIDAEYHGVMGAYNDLIALCDEDDAERLICDYVNDRCTNYAYYIVSHDGASFSSISQIEDAFFDAYELSTSLDSVVRDVHGILDVSKKYKQIRAGWFEDAAIAPLVSHGGIIRPECRTVFDAMWDAGNGNKDRMMASLAIRAMPELVAFYGLAACDDLSLQKVFGKDVASVVDKAFAYVKHDCRTPIKIVVFDDVENDEFCL